MPAAEPSPDGAGGIPLLRDIDKDEDVRVDAVRIVGSKTLYRRGKVWYAYDAVKQSIEELAPEVKDIKRFSEEYFRLVRQASPETQKLLASQKEGEELVIEIPAAEPASPADEAPPVIYHVH